MGGTGRLGVSCRQLQWGAAGKGLERAELCAPLDPFGLLAHSVSERAGVNLWDVQRSGQGSRFVCERNLKDKVPKELSFHLRQNFIPLAGFYRHAPDLQSISAALTAAVNYPELRAAS